MSITTLIPVLASTAVFDQFIAGLGANAPIHDGDASLNLVVDGNNQVIALRQCSSAAELPPLTPSISIGNLINVNKPTYDHYIPRVVPIPTTIEARDPHWCRTMLKRFMCNINLISSNAIIQWPDLPQCNTPPNANARCFAEINTADGSHTFGGRRL